VRQPAGLRVADSLGEGFDRRVARDLLALLGMLCDRVLQLRLLLARTADGVQRALGESGPAADGLGPPGSGGLQQRRPAELLIRRFLPRATASNRRKLAAVVVRKGGDMYARVATFESDPANVDNAINLVRTEVESGNTRAGLEGAKMLMLVNRKSGRGLGVTLFESEEAMRRGDEALNAMNPGASERRTSVEFYEVPVQTVS
jgi:hypothetical protein